MGKGKTIGRANRTTDKQTVRQIDRPKETVKACANGKTKQINRPTNRQTDRQIFKPIETAKAWAKVRQWEEQTASEPKKGDFCDEVNGLVFLMALFSFIWIFYLLCLALLAFIENVLSPISRLSFIVFGVPFQADECVSLNRVNEGQKRWFDV